MTMFNLIDDGAQFTAQSFMESYTKEFRDPVGSQSPKADLAAAFENLMDREVALEDEVAAANGEISENFKYLWLDFISQISHVSSKSRYLLWFRLVQKGPQRSYANGWPLQMIQVSGNSASGPRAPNRRHPARCDLRSPRRRFSGYSPAG
jgi:hypothetical protein